MSIEHSPARGDGALTHLDRMLRAPEVMALTGLSRTTLWRRVRAGTFPAPVELGQNSIGWPASEISAWLKARARRTYGADAPAEAGAAT